MRKRRIFFHCWDTIFFKIKPWGTMFCQGLTLNFSTEQNLNFPQGLVILFCHHYPDDSKKKIKIHIINEFGKFYVPSLWKKHLSQTWKNLMSSTWETLMSGNVRVKILFQAWVMQFFTNIGKLHCKFHVTAQHWNYLSFKNGKFFEWK